MDTGGDVTADDALQRSYDTLAEEYARRLAGELKNKPLDRALLDAFAEMVDGQGLVADIGSGPGQVGRYLVDQGIPVIGIDLSPGMIAVAQRLHPMMTFAVGSILDLPAPDASWAGIIAFYSIIFLAPDKFPIAFREFHRTLRPGGLLLVAFHLGDGRIHEDELWGFDVDLDMYLLEREVIQREIEQAGFEVLAHLERQPNGAVEYPSRRAYILARKGEPGEG
jgi:SAM-dependent methyltransferase